MEKIIYLVRGNKIESYTAFKHRIFELSEHLLETCDLISLKIVLTEEKPPLVSIIPFKKNKIASISIVSENATKPVKVILAKEFSGCYKVTEALPVTYKKEWKDKTITPGVCLLTLFNKKKTIDYTTFINRWHNSHTPLSLKIHPLTHYNRNVVDKKEIENSENWDGIVEEHTQTKSELLNPTKFFGGVVKMIPNMVSVYVDTKSFLDYKTIETYLTQEYFIKS